MLEVFLKGLAFGFLLAVANPPTLLAAGAGWLRTRMGPGLARAINVVSGLGILGFAAWQLNQLFL